MEKYQGHLADGSSVQKHSAGPFYPYVFVLRDAQLGEGKYDYGLMGPSFKDVAWYGSYWQAADVASFLKRFYDDRQRWNRQAQLKGNK